MYEKNEDSWRVWQQIPTRSRVKKCMNANEVIERDNIPTTFQATSVARRRRHHIITSVGSIIIEAVGGGTNSDENDRCTLSLETNLKGSPASLRWAIEDLELPADREAIRDGKGRCLSADGSLKASCINVS